MLKTFFMAVCEASLFIQQVSIKKAAHRGNAGLNCKCNSRMACGLGLFTCRTGSCSETTTGCGITGSMPCKGTCKY